VGAIAVLSLPAQAQLLTEGNFALYDSVSQTAAEYGEVLASGDYDGDGLPDLAIGAPSWDSGSVTNAGEVMLLTNTGTGSFQYYLSSSGTVSGMNLGWAVVFGDFNNDGKDDLAYGAPFLAVNGQASAGRVYVRSDGGATQTFVQGGDLQGTPEAGDKFGGSLAVGDFNDDGFDDLAIGVSGEDVETLMSVVIAAGAVQILYGSVGGLTGVGNQYFHQGLMGGAQANAHFGSDLASGDLNGDDAFSDLVIGEPDRDITGISNAGQVTVMFGTSGGLLTTGAQIIDQSDIGMVNQASDFFGTSLAVADFNRTQACWAPKTCREDLAIGIMGEDVNGAIAAGAVVVLNGSDSGLSLTSPLIMNQGTIGMATSPEDSDYFGRTLASQWLTSSYLKAGAIWGSPDHLLIGAPGEDWNSTVDAGAVHLVFSGGATGLNTGADEQFLMVEAGMATAPMQANAKFGSAMTIADFNLDGTTDLAVSLPGQTVGDFSAAGAVQILFGAPVSIFSDGFEG